MFTFVGTLPFIIFPGKSRHTFAILSRQNSRHASKQHIHKLFFAKTSWNIIVNMDKTGGNGKSPKQSTVAPTKDKKTSIAPAVPTGQPEISEGEKRRTKQFLLSKRGIFATCCLVGLVGLVAILAPVLNKKNTKGVDPPGPDVNNVTGVYVNEYPDIWNIGFPGCDYILKRQNYYFVYFYDYFYDIYFDYDFCYDYNYYDDDY